MKGRYLLLSLALIIIPASFSESRDGGDIDSLLEVIQSSESPDTLLYTAFVHLAWELKSIQPQRSLKYANEALKLAESLNDQIKIANALSYIGVVYWQMGNFRMAMDYHLEAGIIYQNIDNELGIARSNTNMGIIFSDQGHYDNALEYFFRALMIYEKLDNQTGMSVVLNNIGMVYEYQQNYELAENYHLRSLAIKEQKNDMKGISFSFNNLGLAYQGMGEYDKALEFFYKALEIRTSFNDSREIANTSNNLGYLYFLMGDYSNSEEYLRSSHALFEKVGDLSGLSKTKNHLGKLNVVLRNTDLAESYFQESLRIARKVGLNRLISENYLNLSELMASIGNFERGFRYQKSLIHIKDSIFREDNRQRLSELQLVYDRDRKESELQILLKNRQITLLSSQRDKLLRSFLIIGVVLILITLFLLYNRFLIARNANILLEQQKDEITQSNEKLIKLNKNLVEQKKKSEELNRQLSLSNARLKESEKHLIEVNSTKDKFFSIISHDLRNPFAAIVSFSRILKRDISNLSTDDLQELARELDKSVLKINNLLENLLQWSRAQTGKIRYEPEYIAVNEIVKENIFLFKNNALEKRISLIDEVDDDIPVWADRNMTDTVIRNLLSNALKYTDLEGTISIKGEVKNHKAYISIEDNGIGITKENQKKLFRSDTLHSTYGTMDEKGSGLGLLLCKEFVEKQGGEIFFRSEVNVGTVFTFSIPLDQP